jgi:tetratricopeptide (TPR) repeat protein
MRFKILLAAATVLSLAACTTAPKTVVLRGPATLRTTVLDARSPYGQFLAGQAALRAGDTRQAASYFGVAGALGEDPGVIAERSFTALLLAGEVSRAAAVAPQGPEVNEALKRLGALTRAVDALAAGKGKAAQAILKGEDIGFPHRQAVALLGPWAAAAAGDAEGATVQPTLQNDRLVQFFGQLGQARLFERAKRYDEAETDYKALTATAAASDLFVLDYGAFLERRKRHTDAVALYDQALARDPGDEGLKAARLRAASGRKPPPMVSIGQGAAQNLVACAATFAGERQSQFALAYLRLALRLEPGREEAWLLVGDLLNDSEDHAGAIAAYQQIGPASPQYAIAQGKLAWAYQQAGDKALAVETARTIAAKFPADREAQVGLADLLRANERWDESVRILDTVISGDGDRPDWRVLFLRGIALERAGRWPDAEADLKVALKVNPDEPELLNFLGYSWIDRGEHLAEALTMIQKAVAARPQSGAMLDSLGWAYYRLGDYKTAIEKLEAAIELEPGDPDINGHLGDAYWRAGRQIEARFQWTRVLSLDPDDKQRAEASAKLKNGLDMSAPAATSTIALN